MDYEKLSLDACMHAAQNDRLPLRIVIQVKFLNNSRLKFFMYWCITHAIQILHQIVSSSVLKIYSKQTLNIYNLEPRWETSRDFNKDG